MKKVFLFLAIFMLSFSGVLFACGGDDKYDDLKVNLVSIVDKGTEKPLTYDSENDCYLVYYGKEFVVSAEINSNSVAVKNLNFEAESSSALSVVVDKNATSATVKPTAYDENAKYKLSVSSMEMSGKGVLDLYFKVLLPVTKISFNENLGAMKGNDINLTQAITFTSSYWDKTSNPVFSKSEKEIDVELKSFVSNGSSTVSLTKENETYYISNKEAFKLVRDETSGEMSLQVLDDSLNGNLKVEAKSSKYVEGSSDATNFVTETDIKIVPTLKFSDVKITGNQVVFTTGASSDNLKLDMSLYTYPTNATYNFGSMPYFYAMETILFDVEADNYSIKSIFCGDDIVDIVKKNSTFTITANKCGQTFVDFEIDYGFSNSVKYLLSDLIESYKDTKGISYSSDNDNMFRVNVYSLATSVTVSQNGEEKEQIVVYDKYGSADESKGAKIEVKLENIDSTNEADRTVVVTVLDMSNNKVLDIGEYFSICTENGSSIEIKDGAFLLNLADGNTSSGVFYIKAQESKVSEQAQFVFNFKNVVNSKITLKDNTQTNEGLTGEDATVTVKTAKGVTDIVVVGVEEENKIYSFYNLTTANNKLVVQRGVSAGAVVGVYFDEGLTDEKITCKWVGDSEDAVTTTDLTSDIEKNVFNGYSKEGLQFGKVVQVVGSKIGKGSLVFTAGNNFSKSISVEVAETVSNFSIKLTPVNNKENVLITKKSNEEYGVIRGNNLTLSLTDASKAYSISYSSSDSNIASVDANSGIITPYQDGVVTIKATVLYYNFTYMSNNHYCWKLEEKEVSFTLNVFVKGEWKLNTTKLTVYDSSTVSYDKVDNYCRFEFFVVPNGSTAYKNEKNTIKFVVDNSSDVPYISLDSMSFENTNEVKGASISGKVQLPDYINKSKEINITAYIEEYDKTHTLSCILVVEKANKVENINLVASTKVDDIATTVNVNKGETYDEIRVRKNTTIDLNTQLIGNRAEEDVFDNRLRAVVLKNQNDIDSEMSFASLSKTGSEDGYSLDVTGGEKFSLKVGENATNATGEFYVRIIAKDSCSSDSTYKTSKLIKFIIEDGEKQAYSISTYSQLNDIRKEPDKNYQLVNDIAMSVETWTPIENFTGVLNGNGYTIRGLRLGASSSTGDVGLFGKIDAKTKDNVTYYGTVYDLVIASASLTINQPSRNINAGIIAGTNNGIILNVTISYTNIEVNTQKELNIGSAVGVNNGVVLCHSYEISYDDDTSRNTLYFSSSNSAGSVGSIYSRAVSGENLAKSSSVKTYVTGDFMQIVSTGIANIGGLVGTNNGTVNGDYGVASSQSGEVNFVKDNQREVDVFVKINVTYGTISNVQSTIGGIVGLNYGKVSCFAVDGRIGDYDKTNNKALHTLNQVGGAVGENKGDGNSENKGLISKIFSTVKVVGNENVGGVVGASTVNVTTTETKKVKLSNIKVENYDTTSVSPVVIGNNNVGGIVGYATYLSLKDSYSKGYVNKFEANYIDMGDIFAYGENACGGGLVGNGVSVEIGNLFSTFNLVGKYQSTNLKALVGGTTTATATDTFYIGVISTLFAEDSNVDTAMLGVDNSKYYYLLDYADSTDLTSGTGKDCFVARRVLDNTTQVEDNANIKFGYYDSKDATTITNVAKYSDLIEDVPSNLTVTCNGQKVTSDDVIDMAFGKDCYYYETEEDGKTRQTVVLSFGSNKYAYNLKDLFSFASNPMCNLNIVVRVGDSDVASIGDVGQLILKKAGTTTLRFEIKEDASVYVEFTVVVIENFDTLRLAQNGSMTESYFGSKKTVKIDAINNFNFDFIENVNGATKDVGSVTKYSLVYNVKYRENGEGAYQDIESTDGDYLEITAKSIVFKKTGEYKLTVFVEFVIEGKTYRFSNDEWVVEIDSRDDIVDICVNVSNVQLSGLVPSQSSKIFIYANNSNSAVPTIDMSIKGNGLDDKLTSSEYSADKTVYDLANSPFYILLSKTPTLNGKTYVYDMSIVLKSDAYEVQDSSDYVLTCEVVGQDNLTTDLNVVVSPSGVEKISLSYYTYTLGASQLATQVDSSEQTMLYTFSSNKQNSLVGGMGGLFVINLSPYYAKIKSVTVQASTTGKKALSFVQLVKVRDKEDSSKMYYIAAPANEVNADGSISLQLKSVLESAVIKYSENGVSSLEGNLPYRYSFGGEQGATDNSGNLYVRVIAPSSLQNGEDVIITVKVDYIENDDEIIEGVESTTLEVVEQPTAKMQISHDGVARKIIAYTATGTDNASTPDYLDIVPSADGNDYYMSYSVKSSGKNQGANTDYAILEETNTGYRLRLGKNAKVGDVITLSLNVLIAIEGGGKVTRSFEETINVVDVVISGISIYELGDNNVFSMTISSSKALEVKLDGYGTVENMQAIEGKITRAVKEDGSTPYYWFIKNGNKLESLINASSIDNIPFVVKQLGGTDETADELVAYSDYIGANAISSSLSYKMFYKKFYIDGLVNQGTADLRVEFSYVYNKDGKLQLIPENSDFMSDYKSTLDFTVKVLSGDEEKDLIAVASVSDFKNLKNVTGGHYILTENLILDDYVPFEAKFSSFDGNNRIIRITNFSYSSEDKTTINLGLFSTISADSIVKNAIVVLPNSKKGVGDDSATTQYITNLTNYSTVNFGGIAGINEGIVTNCDVIGEQSNDKDGCYVANLYTTTNASVNVGGLVGINHKIITNSRVGRKDNVTTLLASNDGSIPTESQLSKTTYFVMALYGGGNVGGFAGTNNGTISSSYADNLQLEVYNTSGTTSAIKTAGFAVVNNGYIYGSFASGYDENSTATGSSKTRKLGGGIFSNGYIAGFVYENNKYITDCYSNINLSQDYSFAIQTTRIARDSYSSSSKPTAAGGAGFVYSESKDSVIKTSYSLSKIKNDNTSFGPFEKYLSDSTTQQGTIVNCYYLKETEETFTTSGERAKELSDNVVVGTSRSSTNQFATQESFNGFSFDPEVSADFSTFNGQSSGGVWAIRNTSGGSGYPELVSACTIAISYRWQEVSTSDGTTRYREATGYEMGSYKNPYLVYSAEQFNKIIQGNEVVSTSDGEDDSSKFTSNIRLINNIDFSGITQVASTSVEFTSPLSQTSIFDGNYLTMTNIKLEDVSSGSYSFGLFRDIYRAGVKNLTLGVSSIVAGSTTAVGALAGVIVDSNISNISLVPMQNEKGEIFGKNYVGALAGIITASDPSKRNSSDVDKLYYISNINSTLSVTADTSATSTITVDFDIWTKISPIAENAGESSANGSLRLSNLDKNVAYAGGIAGVVDLRQTYNSGSIAVISKELAYNIHVGEFIKNTSTISSESSFKKSVTITSSYVGGLFGLVGSQTMVSRSEFIVDGSTLLASSQIAGGVAGFNYGMISKTYVSYNETNNKTMDSNLQRYVTGQTSSTSGIQLNTNLFDNTNSQPKYIGGLVGVNAGSEISNSGNIVDSYNRVDVRNKNATNVGGIVGASYVGELRNVYTTAGLLGKTTGFAEGEVSYIGGAIGRIYNEPTNSLFRETASGSKTLSLSNIVATNIYETSDFDTLSTYVSSGKTEEQIGALYGKYTNGANTGIVRMDRGAEVYYNQYVLNKYTSSYFGNSNIEDTFSVNNYTTTQGAKAFELWGASSVSGSSKYDEFLSSYLNSKSSYLIQPHQLYLFMLNNNSASSNNLRKTYFSDLKWTSDIWYYKEYDRDGKLYPILDYGYKLNVKEIYTAQEFMDEMSSSSSSQMTYLIMRDLDFSEVENFAPLASSNKAFGGRIIGSDITYTDGGTTYTRYPILFNLNYKLENTSKESSYALFNHASNATFSNLNIVVGEYDVQFNPELTASSRASVLVALAEGVTLTNVNIYSSLRSVVSRIADEAYFDSSFTNDYTVTQGLAKGSGSLYVDASRSFIKTNNYTYTYDETANKFVYTNGSTTKTIDVKIAQIKTNAEYFGGFAATTGETSITIENCSANIDVKIMIDKKLGNAYYGAFMGDGDGRIMSSVASGESGTKLSVQSTYCPEGGPNKDIDNLYVGGISGYFKGEMSYVYIDNLSIEVGGDIRTYEVAKTTGETSQNNDDSANTITQTETENKEEKYIIVQTPIGDTAAGGAYIGGLVGSAGTKDGESGSLTNVFVDNINITTFVKGQTYIGGVVANNTASVSSIYVTSTTVGQSYIEANIDSSTSKNVIGGVFGTSSTESISEVYSNLNIHTISKTYGSLYVGGILGLSTSTVEFRNVVSDANEIELEKVADNGYTYMNYVEAGGIVGNVNDVQFANVLSTVNIIASQDNQMYIGGAVGKVKNLQIENVIVLGNILLSRGLGLDKDTYFYNGDSSKQSIGGLVGSVETSFAVTTEYTAGNNLILSTIRDYAIAQKIESYEGSVVGEVANSATFSDLMSNVYYNENISLVGNNNVLNQNTVSATKLKTGINSFTNIDQNDDLRKIFKEMVSGFKALSSNNPSQALEKAKKGYSNLYNIYYNLENEKFVDGSKLSPYTFGGQAVTNDSYYILTNDVQLSGSIDTTAKGWVINCRGYSLTAMSSSALKPIFKEITENSAITGMLANISINVDSSKYATIATKNNGFIFSCGVAGTFSNGNESSPASNLTSFVVYNYGVISRSFSTANLYADGAAGLVIYNGNSDESDKVGNIYDSFYTGTITDKGTGTSSEFAGIALSSTYGVMSNCYTMADIVSNNKGLYPVVKVADSEYKIKDENGAYSKDAKKNLYRTYYDYIAYVGEYEGTQDITLDEKTYSVERTKSIADTGTSNADFFSYGGIYAWTTTFSGDTELSKLSTTESTTAIIGKTVTKTILDLFQTYWIGQVNNELLINKNLTGSENFDNTWFNYGYITKDFSNVYVNEEELIKKFYTMIYTGNGLNSKESMTTDPTYKVVGFLDQPYNVKHGGILDMLVTENCLQTGKEAEYRYYLFTTDINLKKYNNLTYWSESWDYNNAVFIGDLDGDGHLVRNMFSTHGLVRAIPNNGNTMKETRVRNITFNGCYAKTGLVAGYMNGGEISNIKILDSVDGWDGVNYVYNGNLFETQTIGYDSDGNFVGDNKEKLKSLQMNERVIQIFQEPVTEIVIKSETNPSTTTTKSFSNNRVLFTNAIFAGGLVGYMTDGTIKDIEIDGLNVMAYNRVSNDSASIYNEDVTYAGGLVGIMTGGEIKGGQNSTTDAYVTEVDAKANNKFNIEADEKDIVIKKMTVSSAFNSNCHLQPYSYVGGIAGYLGNDGSGHVANISNVTIKHYDNKKIILCGILAVGGFAGVIDGGKILACKFDLKTSSDGSDVKIGYSKWTMSSNKVSLETVDLSTMVLGNYEDLKANIYVYGYEDSSTSNIFTIDIYLGGIAGAIYSGTISYAQYGSDAKIDINSKRISGYSTIMLGGIVGESYESDSSKPIYITHVDCNGTLRLVGSSELLVGGIIGRMRKGTVQNVTVEGTNKRIEAVSNTISSTGGIDIIGTSPQENKEQIQFYKKIVQAYQKMGDEWKDGNSAFDRFKAYFTNLSQISTATDQWSTEWKMKMAIQVSFLALNSMAGGVVGKLMSGSLIGNDEVEEPDETMSTFKIAGYTIYSSESSGGVVGKISRSDGSVVVKNIRVGVEGKKVIVQSVGTISLTLSAGTSLALALGVTSTYKQDLGEVKTSIGDLYGELDEMSIYAMAGAGLSKSSAGGIVGQIKQTSGTGFSESIVIDNCYSYATVGSMFATYVGGIVGLVSENADNAYNHIIIKNCDNASVLQGYALKSFAGGIVGYLNHGTLYNCTSGGSFGGLWETLSSTFTQTTTSGLWNIIKEKCLNVLSLVLGTPNIAGGIVGYCEDGEVRACSTQSFGSVNMFDSERNSTTTVGMSIVVGVRVAGGIVGMAAKGIFTPQKWKDEEKMTGNQFGIMSNNGIVYSPLGIAGGLFGVLCGKDAKVIGYQAKNYSISQFFTNVIIGAFKGGDNFDDKVKEMLGINEDCGLLINQYFGIVMGFISGGIVGYYDTSSIGSGSSDMGVLSGCINFGRTYTNFVSLISSWFIMLSMNDITNKGTLSGITYNSNANILSTFMAVANNDYETVANGFNISTKADMDWLNDTVSAQVDKAIKTLEDSTFSMGVSAGFVVDGEKLALIDIGIDGTYGPRIKIGFDFATLSTSFEDVNDLIDLTEGISVFKYKHDANWSNNNYLKGEIKNISYGLTKESAVCKIIQSAEKLNLTEDNKKKLQSEKGLVIFDELFPNEVTVTDGTSASTEKLTKGFGASGGIVGMVNGRGGDEGTLMINLCLSYSLNLSVSIVNAFTLNVVCSLGIAGGIVGVATTKVIITSAFNMSNVIGRMAGGIVGLGSDNVQVVSYGGSYNLAEEMQKTFKNMLSQICGSNNDGANATTKYGPVMNTGWINGSVFAGGIFGYANGARINSPEMEEYFYGNHSLGIYASYDWMGNGDTWDDLDEVINFNLGSIGNFWLFAVTNSGSVYSDRFAGGLVGYMDGGTGLYNAKVTGNILGILNDPGIIRSFFTGTYSINISAPYAGGLVGYLNSGIIGGSCNAGYNESYNDYLQGAEDIIGAINNVKGIRISAYRYCDDGGISVNDAQGDSTGSTESAGVDENSFYSGRSYTRGGYAGGIVGAMAGGILGSTLKKGSHLAVNVNQAVKFGYNNSYIIPFVGGAIGLYAVTGDASSLIKEFGNVDVQTTVSNGLFTGGIIGKLWSGGNLTLNFNSDSSYPYVIGTPLKYKSYDFVNKTGELITDSKDKLIVKGKTATFAGGFAGYLENCTLSNMLSCVKIEGDKGCTVGGIVGWLNGGKIENCVVAQLAYTTKEQTGTTTNADGSTRTLTRNIPTKQFIDWNPVSGSSSSGEQNSIYLFDVSNDYSFSGDDIEGFVQNLSSQDADMGNKLKNVFGSGADTYLTRILAQSYVGGVAGILSSYGGAGKDNYASIENCIMYGNMRGGTNTGGIVGQLLEYAKVSSCYNFGNIIEAGNAGGIVALARDRESHVDGDSTIVEKSYVGKDLLISDGIKQGGLDYIKKAISGDDSESSSTSTSSDGPKVFTYDTDNKKIYMYGTQILVLDFGGLEMDYDALKSFFGENMQVISGSMCVGGLVGVMRGYSKLKSGKVGKLVTVKTVVSKKNTLSDNLKDMLIGTYGDTLQDLFGDKFGQVDGIGVAGGVVGTATGHAEVGTSAAEQDLLKQLTKTLINYIFDVENGSKDGFLQGAGKTEGWIAGSLVGKLVEDASIIGGTTGYLVSGSVYAGGIVGYMDTREGISGVQNYTDLSSYAGLKGVYFINGIGIEGGEQCYDGSSPEEDEEDDTSKYLKTSLGGVLGYYHNGSIDVSKTTPMSVVGFSTEFNDLVSDKYFAGGVVGHVHNADVDDSLLTKNGLSVVTGTFSYAGAIVGRISGEKVNISISVDTANESGLSGKTVVALKGAGGIAGAITNNSKMTATSTSIDITATEATLKIENMYNSDSITAVAVGGVVGAILSDSTLKLVNNVSVSGKLTGTYIGGVAGIIAKGGTLDGGGFTVTVNKQTDKDGNAEETAFDDQKSASIGGIVGSLDGGTVQNINNGIRIIGSHTATVGGIAGVMTGGTISNCNNAMEVSLFDGENPARSDNPWANQSNKQDITNTGAESYEDFIEYLRGSVGGIVGKVSVFSFSQLITLSNFNITNFLGTSAKIKDCNSTGSVSGYFFYGSDANAVVDKDQNSGTSSDEQSYKIRIADKRGRFVGTTQKFGAVDITGGNSENKGVFADFNFDELFTAETLWELLTTDVNKLDEFITGKVTKGNVYASYATDWDQKNDEEKAFVKGYKIEAKSYSFTTDGQGNLTRSEDQTAETRYNFKVATGQDGRDVERLDASGAQANYGLGTPSTNQKMAAQKVALTEALKEPSVGVYNVDVISKEQSGSSYTVDTGAGVEPAAMTTYYKFTVTHYSYSLATINVVVSETYQKLQNCGANISFTRKTDTKQGYVSDSGARALLLERLYSNNTIEKFAIDLINKCFEIIT